MSTAAPPQPLPYALRYLSAGLSVIPVNSDGSKLPPVKWKDYQHVRPTRQQLIQWFGNGHRYGIALVCGEGSGGAEAIDIDRPGWWERFEEEAQRRGLEGLVASLPRDLSPSGGGHLYYRCSVIEGNQWLAKELRDIPPDAPVVISRHRETVEVDGKSLPVVEVEGQRFALQTAVETRGAGGYVIVPPSGGSVHPTGKPYRLLCGDLTAIPEITPEERAALLDVARSLTEWTPPPAPPPRPTSDRGPVEGLRPGDDYNNRGDLAALLEKHGWRCDGQRGETSYWLRPGKTRGCSATFGHDGTNVFYVFSSNAAPFEPDTGYSPFTVYALLEHDGDYEAAARELGSLGFGEQQVKGVEIGAKKKDAPPPPPPPEEEEPEAPPATEEPDPVIIPGADDDATDEEPGVAQPPEDHTSTAKFPAWPYTVSGRRLYYYKVSGSGDSRHAEPVKVADFYGTITQNAVTEDGRSLWTVEGRTRQKHRVRAEIEARSFADPRALKAVLTAAAGPLAPVASKMDPHLGPALQKLTAAFGTVKVIHHYDRCGWRDENLREFLLPGHTQDDDIRIRLPRTLPYQVTPTARLALALRALDALCLSKPPEFTTIALAALLGPPAARLMGLDNDRYCLFITGQTGSFKTTFFTLLMALWGEGFIHDSNLCKWGEGGTSYAIGHLATYASDLPIFIDNYKPSTGGGQKAFTSLMHNMLEGGERLRMKRGGNELQFTRELHSWPVCTGEDVPGADAATLARMLVLATHKDSTNVDHLTTAQSLGSHLPAIGREWVKWLEGPGREVAEELGRELPSRRSFWRQVLTDACPLGTPHGRIASNLAVNELFGRLIGRCPAVAVLWSELNQFDSHHLGLLAVAREMAQGAVESNEGQRFLRGLASLLSSGRAVLVGRGQLLSSCSEPDRVIGWKGDGGSVYLDEELAIAAIEKLWGREWLGGVTIPSLRRLLDSLGAIGDRNKPHLTFRLRLPDGTLVRSLHILAEFLSVPDEDEEGTEDE